MKNMTNFIREEVMDLIPIKKEGSLRAIFFVLILMVSSCCKETIKDDVDTGRVDLTFGHSFMNFIVGEWIQISGEKVYVFKRDETYEYYSRVENNSPDEAGTFILVPEGENYDPAIRFYHTGGVDFGDVDYQGLITGYDSYNGVIQMVIVSSDERLGLSMEFKKQ